LGIASDMPAVAPSPNSRGGRSTATLLGDRYSLTTRIAVGGMGEVWAATDTILGRRVAVKVLRDDLVDSPVFLERFRAEARHTAALSHPGIASVFDYGEDRRDDGSCVAYLVMELVAGQPLSKVMRERGALPINTVLSVLAQTADALHAAHVAGVVHRDVKPGNLLMLDDGTVKVTDFGIARAANSVALTEVGQIIGTAQYISPEQAVGGQATPASDVYSLGVIGYEMLAGHPPFTADNAGALAMAHVHQAPPPLPATVPAAVGAAISEALAKEPSERPQGADVFAARLRELQLSTTPHPGAASSPSEDHSPATVPVGADNNAVPPTQVMSTEDGSRTAIMPAGRIVPDLGISQQPYALRRQRRRLGIGLLATIFAVIVFVQLGSAGGDVLPVVSTTTVAPVTYLTIDPNALIGLPVATASDSLTTSGFVVVTDPASGPDVAAGVVTGVAPSGQVPAGATVTLSVGPAPTPPTTVETRKAKKNGKPPKNNDEG
jgi:eukaryotic-like serine/threonine-protein kinase